MADFGILYVVSTPIGNLADMTPRAVTILDQVDIIACEDTRSSKTLLNRFDIKTKCLSYHEHSDERATDVIMEKIQKGEYLLDGSPAPHDILRILGVEKLTEYFVTEVQEVYRLQGVVINDKHIETIVRQMLKRVEVKEPGDSELLTGEVIDLLDINLINEN